MSSPAPQGGAEFNVVNLPIRAPEGAPDLAIPNAQVEKIAELLAIAERCNRLAERARASSRSKALLASGTLSNVEAKVASLEQQLVTQRAQTLALQAQRDALATQLGAAVPVPAPPPVPQEVLDEAKPIRGRRLLVWLAVLGLIVGILAVVDAFMTLVFKEPISGLFQAQAQSAANDRLKAEEKEFASNPARPGESPRERVERLAIALQKRKGPQDQLGRITIPAIGLKTIFFEGAVGSGGEASLRKGAARYEGTKMPGLPGTVGIAGHRTTFGAPFRKVNELKDGNRIVVRMPYAKFTYVVESEKIVSPQTVSVLTSSTRARSAAPGAPATTQKLVLTACHPVGSDRERIIVTGRLIRTDPIQDKTTKA